MLKPVVRFALTGGVATLVHLGVALVLVRLGVAPPVGNAAAFCAAFVVSFWGHHLYTFSGHGAVAHHALFRFLIVAIIGFLWNETMLLSLLATGTTTAAGAILFSTASAALCTFILSRVWAFRRKPLADEGPVLVK
ncbi:GtrA family protein [Paracoccus sp. M683]|uniref:GtrA family protein n=1 Tax=Paracoccus sp. M683 TaxID=2594268 RepID=UPI00117C4A91|nr:GtrA family protein [Paracoccus sp. M683]TRW95283.1 GtrA family protein [Paracoccus sp. M683]